LAGLWHLSRTQVLDQNDNLIVGALAYFYEANTDEAMTVYSSVTLGEVNEHSNPVVADGNGRWPLVFFDDVTDLDLVTPGVQSRQYYRVRVTDAGGVLIYDDLSVPIIGQSTGEGGGVPPPPVDEAALAKTGDVKVRFDDNTLAGWVRMNGKTIGKGAGTERADPDTQALFEHLWAKANQTICEVIGGRGANALADFDANKQLTLPDMRGRAPFGTDIMGRAMPGGSSGRIAAAYMDTGGVNELGASGGDDAIVLTADNIAAHSHDATGVPAVVGPPAVAAKERLKMPAHSHFMVDDGSIGTPGSNPLTAATALSERGDIAADLNLGYILLGGDAAADVGKTSTLAATDITGNTGLNVTTGAAHENMPPFMLFTFYLKL
jgi:microcystin-dependent protein